MCINSINTEVSMYVPLSADLPPHSMLLNLHSVIAYLYIVNK